MSFTEWFISFSIIYSKLIHTATYDWIFFLFFRANTYTIYFYLIYVLHFLYPRWAVDCFHTLATVVSVMDIGMQTHL